MNEQKPATRAEAAAAVEQIHEAEQTVGAFTGELVTAPPLPYITLDSAPSAEPFLSLSVRRVLYLLGLAALVAAPTVGVNFPEYADAINVAGNLLGAAALGTALANPTR